MKKGAARQMILPLVTVIFSCFVVAVFTAVGVLEQTAVVTAGSAARLPVYSVETDRKAVALTFDAAWGNSDTGVLLEVLRKNGARATFFATGDWVDRFPEDVRRIFGAGHEVQNHSDAHPHPTALSREELIADTAACDEKIAAVTGVYPTLYRAPYGEYDDGVIRALESVGKRTIQWDVDSRDWQGRSADEMAASVLSGVRNGSILLFHTDTENTPAALERILPALSERGFEVVTVSALLPEGRFRIDRTGRLFPLEEGEPSAGGR